MAGESDHSLLKQWTKMLRFLAVLLGLAVAIIVLSSYFFAGKVRRFTPNVKQNAQFHSIEAALELFNNEFDAYPPSDANDPAGKPYCGAMKFAEAMMGRDLLGFHRESAFRADGKTADGVTELYPPSVPPDRWPANIRSRKGPYLPPESADCLTLEDVYGPGNTGPLDPNLRVVCDVFTRKYNSGKKAGMPILYYKADTSKTDHDIDNPDNPDNIYDYRDNHALLALGVPGQPEKEHPLYTDPTLFYKITRQFSGNEYSDPNSFILISAGKDGLYGTTDDICNFQFEFPQE